MPSGAAAVNVNANLNFNPQSLNAASKQVQAAFSNINLPTKQVNAFNNSLGRITGQASEFDKSINAATARVFAFGAAVSIINAISQAFKGLISSTIEVEKRLTEINTILGGTSSQLETFRETIFDVAKSTGQSFNTVADAAAELARQGLSAEQTATRLNSALVLTRISGLDSAKSVEALTAAINGFTSAGLTAEQIVNKLVAVDTAFAVSAQDLAEGFSRAGSTAEDAGVSFDELLGLITSVQQTTARGGAVIGNAFKSIFARLSRGTVIEDLQALGVEINQSQSGVEKLKALSSAIDGISDPTKANAIKELAGGVYQINVVSAALKDLSSETSIFANASKTAASATDEAFKRNEELNKTLSAQINQLVQGLTNLGAKIGELTIAPVIEKILNGANKLIEILDSALDPEKGNTFIKGFFKGISNFLSGPGLVIISAGFFKLFQLVAKFAKEGIADLFKIGSQQEKIKNIEGGIVALLQQDANLRAVLLSSSSSQAQKEQAVINAIKQQNALLTQQQALVNSIATAAAKAGVGGFSPTGGFTNKKGTGKFAAGFKQEEAMAKGLGASSSVKAKFGRGTIDGQRFIMNNEEIEIPRFNGGRDSAVIPTYAKGFVPNYASGTDEDLNLLTQKVQSFAKIRKGNNAAQYSQEDRDFAQAVASRYEITSKNDLKSPGTILSAIQNRQERELSKQQKVELAKLGSADNPLDLSPESKNYAFLVPSINFTGNINKEKPEALKSWNSIPNLHFFVTSPISGPQQAEIEQIPDETSEDNKLSEEVFDDMVKHSVAYARRLTNPLMDLANKQSDPELKTSIKKRLGEGGNRGAWGAVLSAAGAAFEAAVTEGLGIEEDSGKVGGDFDVKYMSKNPKVAELFGLGGEIISSDFKVRKSSSTLSSFGKKILNDNASHFLKKLEEANKAKKQPKPATSQSNKGKKRKATKKSKAAGFIPNYSLNKGVPVSKIRAHFDDEGNPVAVTNTEHENGLIDAIRRERQGIGMTARTASGFVPNYAAPQTGGGSNIGASIGKVFAITQVLGLLESGFSDVSDKTKEEIE
ncbi:MAG: phage tail tape measure protein, partial [Candidatus Nanopelagicales bacterium]